MKSMRSFLDIAMPLTRNGFSIVRLVLSRTVAETPEKGCRLWGTNAVAKNKNRPFGGAWLFQIRACNFGVFGALGTFFIDGCCDRIASQVLQLCEECTSASFDRLSRLAQDRVSARWHRGYLGFSRPCFCDDRFCQRADAVNNLLRIEAAFAGELLPVPPHEVIAPTLAGDGLREVLGDVFPNFAAHDIVHRCSDAPLLICPRVHKAGAQAVYGFPNGFPIVRGELP